MLVVGLNLGSGIGILVKKDTAVILLAKITHAKLLLYGKDHSLRTLV